MLFVQSNSASSGSNVASLTCTLTTQNVTAGNLLVASTGCNNANTIWGISDNLNGAWGPPAILASNSTGGAIWVYPNSLGGSCTVTVFANPARAMGLAVLEFSGASVAPAAFAVDKTASQLNSTIGSPTTASTAATTMAIEAVVGCIAGNSTHTWTPTNGTMVTSSASGQYFTCSYYITSTTGAQSLAWTVDGTVTGMGFIATIFPVDIGSAILQGVSA